MNVISASRRTDLPAFYWQWFMNRLAAGRCRVAHPFDPRRIREISLRPEDVIGIVFWTRNAGPMLADLDRLEAGGYAFYVHYTVTGYPRLLEPHAPPPDAAVATLRELSERITPERVLWRYDPIVFSTGTPPEYHVERFSRLARELRGATSLVTVSFCDPYRKSQRAFDRLSAASGWTFEDGGGAARVDLLRRLSEVAAGCGMQLVTCAEDDLGVPGVGAARCVDPGLLSRLRPDLELHLRPAATRPGCGCAPSVDIGAYDTCTYGCIYCYANRGSALARRRHAEHDPSDDLLCRPRPVSSPNG
jgi:hypothetical protein